jgi:hypothetical protein
VDGDRLLELLRQGRVPIIEKIRPYEDFCASEVWQPGRSLTMLRRIEFR